MSNNSQDSSGKWVKSVLGSSNFDGGSLFIKIKKIRTIPGCFTFFRFE